MYRFGICCIRLRKRKGKLAPDSRRKPIANPHDRLAKWFLIQPHVARDLFACYLPAEYVASLDMDSLTPVRGDLVDARLNLDSLDFLFRVRRKGSAEGNKGEFRYLPVEHKSTREPLAELQVTRYLHAAWSVYRHPETDGADPAPLPRPFPSSSTTDRGSGGPTRFQELVAMAPEEREWTPHFSTLVFDVFGDSLDGLEGKPDFSNFLQLQKFGRGPKLAAQLRGIFGLVPVTGREGREFVDLVRTIGDYLDAAGKVDIAMLKRAIRECLPTE